MIYEITVVGRPTPAQQQAIYEKLVRRTDARRETTVVGRPTPAQQQAIYETLVRIQGEKTK